MGSQKNYFSELAKVNFLSYTLASILLKNGADPNISVIERI
jgi:hypothetical protein